jgi:hypothetical protein
MTGLPEIFDEIYHSEKWVDGLTSPKSGSGSHPDNAKPYVQFVQEVISNNHLLSVTDIGHGDWRMWRDFNFEGVKYTGIEISEKAHDLAMEATPVADRNFLLQDVIRNNRIPQSELLITKDVLQHLSNDNIQKLLLLFTKHPLIIICNDIYTPLSFFGALRFYTRLRTRLKSLLNLKNPFFLVRRENNSDVINGGFRGLNLQLDPFRSILNTHYLVETFDYDGPKRDGIKKRVYFFVGLDEVH